MPALGSQCTLFRAVCTGNERKRYIFYLKILLICEWVYQTDIESLCPPLKPFTLLGVQSWVRFCQQEFGMFHHPAWAVGSHSSGPPVGGTPQILVDKTSSMTGCLRVYNYTNDFLICMDTWFIHLVRSAGNVPASLCSSHFKTHSLGQIVVKLFLKCWHGGCRQMVDGIR